MYQVNQQAQQAPEVMTVDEAALYLQVSKDSLYGYAAQGKVPAFRLGNRWRFSKSLLDAWMELQSKAARRD